MSTNKLDAIVGVGGKVELMLPLPAGTAVEVLVRDPDTADNFSDEMEWNDHLQDRLDALDRDGVDPRPWREAIDEVRNRLRSRGESH